MKKRHYILVLSFLMMIFVSGCSKKSAEPKEVANIFMNHFIYQKDTDKFKETFVDGDLLSKQLSLMTDTFENTFSDVFDSVVGNLTEEEKDKISTDLMTKVREKSSYISSVKELDKKKIEVTYEISGFDYASLVEKTLESVFKELLRETDLSDNVAKRGLISSFDDALEETSYVDKQIFITLTFEKVKNQWQLSENQDEKLEEILLAVVSGTKDKEAYDEKMSEMLERALKKASDTLA